MTVDDRGGGCVRLAAEVQMNFRIVPTCPCWRCGGGATKVGERGKGKCDGGRR